MATLKEDGHHITLPAYIGDAVDREAMVADLSMAGAVRALLLGAIKDGQASRLIGIGMDLLPPKETKRRADPKRSAWKKVGKGATGVAAVYGRGAYRMARRGHTGQWMKSDHGWYLTGPGFDKPMFLGQHKQAAVDRANEIIVSLDQKRKNER